MAYMAGRLPLDPAQVEGKAPRHVGHQGAARKGSYMGGGRHRDGLVEGLFLISSANKKITNKFANKLLVVCRERIFRSNYVAGRKLKNR